MEKVIRIDLFNESDLTNKYNDSIVSKDLINYIFEQAKFINNKDSIKVIIIKNFDKDVDIIKLIKESLNEEYLSTLKKTYLNDIKQILFLLFGIVCLFLSTIIHNSIIKEIILIGGWVLIWEMLDSQLFSDTQLKRNKVVLKKLLNAEFIQK